MTAWFQQRFAPAAGTFLCDAQNIADGQVLEFRFGGESPFAFRMFIYNDQGTFRAFRNSCPHFDVPLNHTPDELFSPDGRYFVCMTHYAQFNKHNGMCVSGPCTGESLESIPLQWDGERLLIGAD